MNFTHELSCTKSKFCTIVLLGKEAMGCWMLKDEGYSKTRKFVVSLRVGRLMRA